MTSYYLRQINNCLCYTQNSKPVQKVTNNYLNVWMQKQDFPTKTRTDHFVTFSNGLSGHQQHMAHITTVLWFLSTQRGTDGQLGGREKTVGTVGWWVTPQPCVNKPTFHFHGHPFEGNLSDKCVSIGSRLQGFCGCSFPSNASDERKLECENCYISLLLTFLTSPSFIYLFIPHAYFI